MPSGLKFFACLATLPMQVWKAARLRRPEGMSVRFDHEGLLHPPVRVRALQTAAVRAF